MLKIPITRGHSTRLKVKSESQSQTFIKKINTKDKHPYKISAYDQQSQVCCKCERLFNILLLFSIQKKKKSS